MVKAAALSLETIARAILWEMFLDTGGRRARFRAVIKADDTFNMRYGFGQSTRLVKNNEIGRGELLEIFTALTVIPKLAASSIALPTATGVET